MYSSRKIAICAKRSAGVSGSNESCERGRGGRKVEGIRSGGIDDGESIAGEVDAWQTLAVDAI